MVDEILVNGVDAETGNYALEPLRGRDLAERILPDSRLSRAELREYQWWVERYGLDDPRRAPIRDVDPYDLASAGWGVLFAPDADPRVREALRPLLERRREQAGPLYQEFSYRPGQTKLDFLAAHRAFVGPADPSSIPYYLLIVGDPGSVPFSFQLDLDIQYSVGRLWFDELEGFARYAKSVVREEEGRSSRPRRATFFGVENSDDRATWESCEQLIRPLTRTLSRAAEDWDVRCWAGAEATKERLVHMLGGAETPSLLIASGHSLCFPAGHPRQVWEQGALLCQDWPGPSAWQGPIPPEFYFSARDVPDGENLQGMIAFLCASFAGGTPELDHLSSGSGEGSARLAPAPFVAHLPQRLLSHPEGSALAVVAPVGRVWTPSGRFGRSWVRVLERALERLLTGSSVGVALDDLNQHYVGLAVELSEMWEYQDFRREVGREQFADLWRATQDARSFAVLGDPAVRLAPSG